MGVSATDISNSLKTEMIEYGVRELRGPDYNEYSNIDKTMKMREPSKVLGLSGQRYLTFLKNFGKFTGIVGVGLSAWDLWTYYNSGGNNIGTYTRLVTNLAVSGISFFGPVGAVIGATYFLTTTIIQ